MSLVPRRSKRKLQNCQSCSEPDDSDMARCDECGKWSHFRCAGVGIEVEQFYWSCHRCTDTFVKKKARKMDIKVKSKKPKMETCSSFVDHELNVIGLAEEEVNMEKKNLRPLSNLTFNKPQINIDGSTNSKKMKEDIVKLKKEIERLRIKPLSVDASTWTDLEVNDVATETVVEVGRDAYTETDVEEGRDASTETDVEVEHHVSTETNVDVGAEIQGEKEITETGIEAGGMGEASGVAVTEIEAKFPFLETDEAENFEKLLMDSPLFNTISILLVSNCGTGAKVPLNVLNNIMSKSLQGQLNWENKGKTIQSFPNILRLIHSVGRIAYGVYNTKSANEMLKNSLRNARAKKK